eukprot:m.138189 g.138189  ORF g.138189 m.138189 type:complete len:495 (+) comp29977_c0_seq1:158-1642(+)
MQVSDSDSEDLDMPRSYLHSAASKGDCLAVQSAVDDGEKVDTEDLSKQTALHWAARKGHLRAAVVLVSNKADLDKKTKHGKTALDLARESAQTDVVNFLEDARNIRIGRPKASGSPKKNAANVSLPLSLSSSSLSPTRRTASPTRSKPRSVEGKVTAETENQMIEWAKDAASVFLAEAKVKKDKETAILEKALAADTARKSKENKAAAMIATLQASLLTMKEGISDSTPTKAANSTPSKPTPSASKTPLRTPSLRKATTTSTPTTPATSRPTITITPSPGAAKDFNSRKPVLDRQPSGGKIMTAADVANRRLSEEAKKVRRTPSKEALNLGASPSESGVEWVKEQNELKAKKKDASKERKQRFAIAKEATEKRARMGAEKKAEEQRLEKIALARKQANDRVKRARLKTPSTANTPTTNNNTPTTNNNNTTTTTTTTNPNCQHHRPPALPPLSSSTTTIPIPIPIPSYRPPPPHRRHEKPTGRRQPTQHTDLARQ